MRPRFFVEPAGLESRDGVAGASVLGSPSERPPLGLVVELSPSDARHARTVLRARHGEPCEVVLVGTRVLGDAVFEEVGDRVTARVTAWVAPAPGIRAELLLVQGLPQPRKVDDIVEKGTEVGIDSFMIVMAAGSPRVPHERMAARAPRWQTIASEAAKQSKQLTIPEVRTAESLHQALDQISSEGWRSVCLTPGAADHLGVVVGGGTGVGGPAHPREGSVRWALWVGPEGGWSAAEVDLLSAGGCLPATLGTRVLRAEAAGPVAGALARYVLLDW